MRMTKRLVCLLAALLITIPVVAVPATALGQSAGDQQYVDPFQNNGNGNNNGNSGSGSQSNSNSNTSASQQTSPTTATGDTAGASAQDPASQNGSLPRTGEDLGGIALMGFVLVGGGFALRRAWPLPE